MDCEGGCDKHLEADTCASNNKHVSFSPLIMVLNSDQSGTNPEGTEHSSAESPDSSDTVSSCSSISTFDDFIPINPQILLKSRGENTLHQPNGGTKPSYENEKSNVTSEAFYRLGESTNGTPESTSQSSDVTRESVMEHMFPTPSSSIQVMVWPEDFDCNGICASHSSRPSIPVEASAASDDSLINIHVRNKISFRDDASTTDTDLYKSEERPKSRELFKTVELCQSGVEPNRKLDMTKAIGEDVKPGEKGMVDEPINYVSKAPMNNHVDTSIGDVRDSSSAKCQSDKVETTNQPIALPIKKKSSSPFCHGHDCCLTFRCCKWPICCSKWPGCSFKWFIQPSCSRNCWSWLGCCCKWPSCHCKYPIWSSCCVKRKC